MKENKYQEIMSHVELTPEASERILDGIRDRKEEAVPETTAGETGKKRKVSPGRIAVYAAAACLCLVIGTVAGAGLTGKQSGGYRQSETAYQDADANDAYPDDGYYGDEVADDVETGSGAEEEIESSDAAKDKRKQLRDSLAGEKLIYRCSLNVETQDYDKSIGSILESIRKTGGYIESENEYAGGGYTDESAPGKERTNEMVVRVPADRYDSFVEEVSSFGTVTRKSQDVENINKAYHDTEVTIEALKIQEKRLLDMMKKADTIQDMITVEDRLTEVQTELKQYEETLAGMDDLVSYATVSITLREVKQYTETPDTSFARKAHGRLESGIKAVKALLSGLILTVLYLLPFLVIAAVVILVIFLIRRNKNRRNCSL